MFSGVEVQYSSNFNVKYATFSCSYSTEGWGDERGLLQQREIQGAAGTMFIVPIKQTKNQLYISLWSVNLLRSLSKSATDRHLWTENLSCYWNKLNLVVSTAQRSTSKQPFFKIIYTFKNTQPSFERVRAIAWGKGLLGRSMVL